MNELETSDSLEVLDETEKDIIPYKYAITSYGADYLVDGLVSRLDKDIIFVPEFQRKFVWNLRTASRFIESLLLGLPVPGIFLSKEPDTAKMLIIDGQQRLKTLQFFYNGIFRSREFKLVNVQDRFIGKTYKTLDEEDRIRLDDSIIHATIVKQDEPSDDQSSIFHIFERLNTGGMMLRAQEIRACIFHGPFNKLLASLNVFEKWREIYGNPSNRLKDQELILRFFALYFFLDEYERPMNEFLNKYMGANRNLKLHSLELLTTKFHSVINVIAINFKNRAFKLEKVINAAVYDSVMIGVAKRLDVGPITDEKKFKIAYQLLLKNTNYLEASEKATSDKPSVKKRMELAQKAFQSLK